MMLATTFTEDPGNWNDNILTIYAGWVFLVTGFVFAVEFIAQGVRRALNGDEEGYVDD
jgi:hypothetical protein